MPTSQLRKHRSTWKGQWSRGREHWPGRRGSWPCPGCPGAEFSCHLCPSGPPVYSGSFTGPAQPVEASRSTPWLCCPQCERTVQAGGMENSREPLHPGCPGAPNGGGNTQDLLQAVLSKPQAGPLHTLPRQPSPGGRMRAHLHTPHTRAHMLKQAPAAGRLWTQLVAPGASCLWNAPNLPVPRWWLTNFVSL